MSEVHWPSQSPDLGVAPWLAGACRQSLGCSLQLSHWNSPSLPLNTAQALTKLFVVFTFVGNVILVLVLLGNLSLDIPFLLTVITKSFQQKLVCRPEFYHSECYRGITRKCLSVIFPRCFITFLSDKLFIRLLMRVF